MHSRHFVHGDVKPANFLMGLGDRDNQVYLIDFSLARMYRDTKTHLHIPYNKNCYPTGTASFASINNHLGVERSRRDDMESLAYILVYLLRGSLPWLGVRPAINMQWLDTTLQQKMGLPLNLLGSACPNKFKLFLNYTRNLCFNEKPDYAYLHKSFHDLVMREGYQSDRPFVRCMISNIPDSWGAGATFKHNKQKVLQGKDTGQSGNKKYVPCLSQLTIYLIVL